MPALNILPASPAPELPIVLSPQYAVQEVTFGDGYTQLATNGMNARSDTVPLSWSFLNKRERNSIVGFLEAHAPASPFRYTVPGYKTQIYTCREWSVREVSPGFYDVSAKLVQYHGGTAVAFYEEPVWTAAVVRNPDGTVTVREV